MGHIVSAKAEESLGLSLSLTAIQVVVYFAFILMSCFSAKSLGAIVPGIGLPLSFIFGLTVIACGTILTVYYVVRVNATERD